MIAPITTFDSKVNELEWWSRLSYERSDKLECPTELVGVVMCFAFLFKANERLEGQ